ncbi:hypothetical protein J3R82DRAFT_2421 [Butyriboletus roseoflavus]|nr:hypothetical protein J3R82DRAFT_2421 [Butyriboletus roseoflavus]
MSMMDPQREQCNQCPPLPTACNELDCIFTPECTDQCLVLACDDPDHASKSCLVPNPCDGICDDCTSLDEIVSISLPIPAHGPSRTPQLQCCTDYHSYCTHPESHDPTPFMHWADSFSDLPCECAGDLQSTYPPSTLPLSIQTLISDSSISSSASSSPSLPPFSPQLHVPSPFPLHSTPIPSFPCMWANCGSVFNSLSDLVGHVNLHHLCIVDTQTHSATLPLQPQNDPHIFPQPPLSCHWGDCAMFPSPASIPTSSSASSDDDVLNILTAHLLQDHLGLSHPFPPSALHHPPPPDLHNPSGTVHQQLISPDPPSHDCSGTHVCKWKACAQSFPSCDDLTTHIASVHIGGGKAHYECFWEGCNRHGTNGFSSKQKISRHLQSHTGHRPFQCQVCNQNFSEAATLQQHMRRHTQEKPYVCDFPGCGKAFAITGALTIHKRTHNGSRPFKCKFCDKAFSESSNLSKHVSQHTLKGIPSRSLGYQLRTHTGVRPYECTQIGCMKAFARPDQLARHMNVHRKKDSIG